MTGKRKGRVLDRAPLVCAVTFLFMLAVSNQNMLLADEVGKRLYENYRATCHGELGAGNGTGFDTGPRLSDLASRNHGVFPLDEVVRVIEGRDQYRAHGSPMPKWGSKFDRLFGLGSEATKNEGDAWIQSLARYVGELQR